MWHDRLCHETQRQFTSQDTFNKGEIINSRELCRVADIFDLRSGRSSGGHSPHRSYITSKIATLAPETKQWDRWRTDHRSFDINLMSIENIPSRGAFSKGRNIIGCTSKWGMIWVPCYCMVSLYHAFSAWQIFFYILLTQTVATGEVLAYVYCTARVHMFSFKNNLLSIWKINFPRFRAKPSQ
jgi:hypothetical protein